MAKNDFDPELQGKLLNQGVFFQILQKLGKFWLETTRKNYRRGYVIIETG